jgi:hypothetical protein
MKLNQTTIGELYAALSPIEIKQLSAYLDEKPNDKVKKLHQWMVKLTKENMLKDCDTDFLVQKILGENAIYSSYTTLTHLLIHHIKDYLILSKVKEKNIYTETLWGEILIERGLKRNLLLKLTNFKIDLYNDSYALMKKFFHDREEFYYSYLTLNKKNYVKMIDDHKSHIRSFKEYLIYYLFENYYSLLSLAKSGSIKIDLDEIEEYSKSIPPSSNKLIRLNQLNLNLELNQTSEAYYELKRFFSENISLWSQEVYIQLVPVLNNYIQIQIYKGNESMEKENYDFLSLLYQTKILFAPGVFTIIRLANFIRLELMYGNIENAERHLKDFLPLVSLSQKESFQCWLESRIAFAKKEFKLSLRKISIINPSDSIFYFQRFKIMLIKNYIMLADIDRLMAERENFYKYINHQKNIQEDEKRRHKLFIKYTEYLTNARYEYLTDYMKKRIENALLQTSPYFSEKQWVRERWEELKILNS